MRHQKVDTMFMFILIDFNDHDMQTHCYGHNRHHTKSDQSKNHERIDK